MKVFSRAIIVAGAWKMKKKKTWLSFSYVSKTKKKREKNGAKITMQIIFVFLSNVFGKFDVVGFVMEIDWFLLLLWLLLMF